METTVGVPAGKQAIIAAKLGAVLDLVTVIREDLGAVDLANELWDAILEIARKHDIEI